MDPAGCNFQIPRDNCTLETCCVQHQGVLEYQPSLVGNAIYAAFFGAILLAQTIQFLFYRSTYGFYIGMACGLILEIVGYVGRILMHSNPFNINNFILYLVCLTIAPAFLMASIYLCIGRIVVAYGTQHSRVKPRDYALICIVCDLVSLILQAVGGAIAATAAKGAGGDVLTGTHIMVAGLACQLFSTILFAILCADFAFSCYKSKNDRNLDFVDLTRSWRWKGFLLALVAATILIFIRSAYRVDELQGGFSSSAANNQTLFMIFEGPMIIASCLFITVFHPGWSFHGRWDMANWGFSGRDRRGAHKQTELSNMDSPTAGLVPS